MSIIKNEIFLKMKQKYIFYECLEHCWKWNLCFIFLFINLFFFHWNSFEYGKSIIFWKFEKSQNLKKKLYWNLNTINSHSLPFNTTWLNHPPIINFFFFASFLHDFLLWRVEFLWKENFLFGWKFNFTPKLKNILS